MSFRLFVAAAALLSASLAARADTSTFDFTYSSVSGGVAGETATVTGSFTVSYPAGERTGTLTAFTFTNTIDSSDGDSTFTYNGLGDVASSSFVLTLSGEDIALATITTKALFGTNAGFGAVEFVLQDNEGTISDSTSYEGNGNAPDALAGNTTGGGTVTFVSKISVTPEPSSFLLLGTGMLGVASVMKRRFA